MSNSTIDYSNEISCSGEIHYFIYIFFVFHFREVERYNSQNPEEQEVTIQTLKEQMQKLKLQVAKSNRAVVIVERQLDDIPDRTELAQYQRRFHELYSESK